MATKRIKDLVTTKYNGFMALDDADGTGKFPIENLLNSLAPIFDENQSWAMHQLVMYEGKLYKFNKDHSGAWSSADADQISVEDYIAWKSLRTPFILDGISQKNVLFFKPDSFKDYEIEFSLQNWQAPDAGVSFQIYAISNANVEHVIYEISNQSNVTINKKYKVNFPASWDIDRLGIYIKSSSRINQYVRIKECDSGHLVYSREVDGENDSYTETFVHNLFDDHIYLCKFDWSKASFDNVTRRKLSISQRSGGVSTDIYLPDVAEPLIDHFVYKTGQNVEWLSFNFRCDSGSKALFDIVDITDNLVKVADAKSVVWSPYYVDANSGTLYDGAGLNVNACIPIKGLLWVDVVMGIAPSVSDTGIAFFDAGMNYISGKKIDDNAGERSYRHYQVRVPEGACYCYVSFYTQYLDKFELSGVTETALEYAVYKKHNPEHFIGHLHTYISENTASSYTSLDNVPTSDLYTMYDAIASAHPDYFRRVADLGTVTRADDSEQFVIRSYQMKFNGMVAFADEPSGSQVVTPTNNKWFPGNDPRKLLIVSGMHGEEKTPTIGLALALEELMTSDDPNAQFIRNNFVLEIIPCLNPAGWDMCRRGNCNNKVMNRAEAENEPETLMYMDWIEENADAFFLFDFHGTQGHFAYTPTHMRLPSYNSVMKMTERLSSALYKSNKDLWASIDQAFTQYAPYLVAQYQFPLAWERARVNCRMFQDFGMESVFIETPDSISLGNLAQNDKRGCKITKELFFNLVPLIGTMGSNFDYL